MPVVSEFGLNRRCFGFEIEDPPSNEASQDGNVCDDNCDVVLNMTDAVVDWICPVRFEKAVQAVAVREVDLCGTDASDTKAVSFDSMKAKVVRTQD